MTGIYIYISLHDRHIYIYISLHDRHIYIYIYISHYMTGIYITLHDRQLLNSLKFLPKHNCQFHTKAHTHTHTHTHTYNKLKKVYSIYSNSDDVAVFNMVSSAAEVEAARACLLPQLLCTLPSTTCRCLVVELGLTLCILLSANNNIHKCAVKQIIIIVTPIPQDLPWPRISTDLEYL